MAIDSYSFLDFASRQIMKAWLLADLYSDRIGGHNGV